MFVYVLNPKGECYSIFNAIAVALSHLFIGATLMVILFYSIKNSFKDLHIMLCSFGFHFFSAEAILGLNYANGWSTPMRLRHRTLAHVYLQLCGVCCAVAGTVIVILAKGISSNLHGITGLIAAVLAATSVLSGVMALCGKKPWFLTLHMLFGIQAFLLSSVGLISGLLCKPFKDWAGESIVYILIALIAFYTTFIVTSSVLKCLARV